VFVLFFFGFFLLFQAQHPPPVPVISSNFSSTVYLTVKTCEKKKTNKQKQTKQNKTNKLVVRFASR